MTTSERCPCGSTMPYAGCCGRWHQGPQHLQAPTAEALMRSRYSAFVLDLRGYLLDTWHPAHRPAEIDPPTVGLRWLGLEVRHHEVQDEHHATVEFVARNKVAGRAMRVHERSRFVRESGRWLYLDGEML